MGYCNSARSLSSWAVRWLGDGDEEAEEEEGEEGRPALNRTRVLGKW